MSGRAEDGRVLCDGCGFVVLTGNPPSDRCSFCSYHNVIPSAEGIATFGGYAAYPAARKRVKAKLATFAAPASVVPRPDEEGER